MEYNNVEEAKKDFGYNPLSFPIGIKKEIEEYLIEKKK